MYLSALLINVGADPDRPRPGRLWLRNVYRVHQRLCMAFPSAARITEDADFLQPFRPEDFATAQVHVDRGVDAGFLFRIDPQPGDGVVILVQSAIRPDWDYAFHNADYLLAAPPGVKPFTPSFASEQLLRFRLRANPTKRLPAQHAVDATGKAKDGPRVQLFREEEQRCWLQRKGQECGFAIIDCRVSGTERQVSWKEASKVTHQAVTFDGLLRVIDPAAFLQAVERGVGPGKGFGFGLLSVARGGG